MNTRDRELLELAAKAAGDQRVQPGQPHFTRWLGQDDGVDFMTTWNPLEDDGDALRLAVKLGIETRRPSRSRSIGRVVQSWFSADGNPMRSASSSVSCAVDGCVLSATRRSIVLAAASIGRFKQ